MKETDNTALIEIAATVLNPIQVQGRLFADVGAAVVSAAGIFLPASALIRLAGVSAPSGAL